MSITAISFFDLDHTLLAINSSFNFAKRLDRRSFFDLSPIFFCFYYYVQFQYFSLSVNDLHQKAFEKIFKGRLLSELELTASSFLDEILPMSFYVPALKKLQEAQKLGHYTVILSSSPSFLVDPIAHILGLDTAFATSYSCNELGEVMEIKKIIDGEAKANIVHELQKKWQLDPKNLYGYSDSELDLPFLNSVGNPIAVNPDNKLKGICRERGWPII